MSDSSITPNSVKRFVPAAILIVGMLALLAIMRHYDIRLDESFWQRLATHHALLQSWIEQYFLLTALGFVLLYALAVAFSLPGALFLTLAGGAIFGWLGWCWWWWRRLLVRYWCFWRRGGRWRISFAVRVRLY